MRPSSLRCHVVKSARTFRPAKVGRKYSCVGAFHTRVSKFVFWRVSSSSEATICWSSGGATGPGVARATLDISRTRSRRAASPATEAVHPSRVEASTETRNPWDTSSSRSDGWTAASWRSWIIWRIARARSLSI